MTKTSRRLLTGLLLASAAAFCASPAIVAAQQPTPGQGGAAAQQTAPTGAPTGGGAAAQQTAPSGEAAPGGAAAGGGGTKGEDGKYVTADGYPTFNIGEGGQIDWYTYSGFRRYHSECHVCHGPDGAGSSIAPALATSLKHLSYEDFTEIVVNGRQNGNSVMPSFGENLNVMCYLDDIYVYLKARSTDQLPRGRPGNREDKPEAAKEAENACLGRS